MTDCAIVFEHPLTAETLRLTKTNNSNELNVTSPTSSMSNGLNSNLSKIISLQTLNGK